MKRFAAAMLAVLFLMGCSAGNSDMDRAIGLRNALLNGNGCSFTAVVTADYGDVTYTFTMLCQADASGGLTFELTQPESISGITGSISDTQGHLTFDGQALLFEMLADEQITPVSGPWLLLRTLRGGYISACGQDDDCLLLKIDDSYFGDSLQLDVWIGEDDMPVRAEFLWKGRRIVSMDVSDFVIV